MKTTFLKFAFIVIAAVAIHSCKDDDDDDPAPSPTADQNFYNEVIASGYTFYQSGNTLPGISPSTHGSFKLRFNSTALGALDSTGELPVGGTFPTGSILVKEVYNGGNLDLFAVMKKDPANTNAGSGWLWAEYDTDGTVITTVTSKGSPTCVSCHASNPTRDMVKTFDLH